MSDSIDRLDFFLQQRGVNRTKLATMIGASTSSVHNTFKKESKPRLEMLEAIHPHFPELNLDWVMTGRGNMLVSDQTMVSNQEAIDSQGYLNPNIRLGDISKRQVDSIIEAAKEKKTIPSHAKSHLEAAIIDILWRTGTDSFIKQQELIIKKDITIKELLEAALENTKMVSNLNRKVSELNSRLEQYQNKA